MSQISPTEGITQAMLDSMNVEQCMKDNRANLEKYGGVDGLASALGISLETGLTHEQVITMRAKYGTNMFPETPLKGFFALFIEAFGDTTLLILLAAASVSLGIGIYEDPGHGYIEGLAIFIAVFLVAGISAGNDYSKELQFKALEASSANDERSSVLRQGSIERINPRDIVVGDILVMQAGDSISADCIIVDKNVVLANESGLTGEPDDLKKSRNGDPFLLSSCLITEGEQSNALVIGIGTHSQWGKIKANLVTEPVNTPLQDKLEDMTTFIGYIGIVAAIGTFVAKIIRIFTVDKDVYPSPQKGVISAFILAVTIVVVAIPEGLPLAVTIALAYSTKQMYKDNNFIRVLAACETMGNATNICSDKTGTLTENRMTVVEGYFGNVFYHQDEFREVKLPPTTEKLVAEQSCLNRVAYLVYNDAEGKPLHKPAIIGNKTEGALMLMSKMWGYDYAEVQKKLFNPDTDKVFSFNSGKKRSTCIIHRSDGTVTVFCKGASEWVMKDCTKVLDKSGDTIPMTAEKRTEIENLINQMADRALRTLCLAHKDYKSAAELPSDWRSNPPDNSDLICDCIVGIIDPLRDDVKEAVATAQRAGVTVRMVTGDNIMTARAIARQCGIYTDGGVAVEGPNFRAMAPAEVDAILPKLQVMGRSSPDDKYLLVTRLNGYAIPTNKEEWEKKHADKIGVSWEKDKDRLLPGYREEWEATRPHGGQVVGVTGDGTNDAPALKAADVGLAMGITGTKVAQGASDIVILDDRFSSIVKAILWGRSVYDSVRKFLQFQITVNLVALSLVFISACSGVVTPLNAVQMLWVNLIMDTMGALALATEPPQQSLLHRKPYKRTASLISWPMWRNIIVQAIFQLTLLLILLYIGPQIFNVPKGEPCKRFGRISSKEKYFNPANLKIIPDYNATLYPSVISCSTFTQKCPRNKDTFNGDCFYDDNHLTGGYSYKFKDIEDFEDECLECSKKDYRHGTTIFNTFIFCQIFNEYTARDLFDEWNFLKDILSNMTFIYVSIFSIGAQIFLVEIGDDFVKTAHLNAEQWLICVALAFIGSVIGMLMRFIPVKEDPASFFDNSEEMSVASPVKAKKEIELVSNEEKT